MEGPEWPVRGMLLADRYRLVELCGVGGMSVVWRADDLLLDRPVAVKALSEPYAADVRLRSRIMKEARAAGRLSHPAVTAVYDYGEAVRASGAIVPFVVMELLEGQSLQERLAAGPLPWQEAVEICARIAEALAQLHRQGVVHRDVTPGNIICGPTGVKILDFGISALVGEADDDGTGITFGTIEYVAPERLDGAPASGATDVFALGVLLFELVSGGPPFPAQTWDDLATVYERRPVAPPAPLPAPIGELCAQCLAMAPEDRPSAAEAAAALTRALAATVPAARPPHADAERTTVEQVHRTVAFTSRRPRARRSRARAIVMSLAALAIPVAVALPFLLPERGERVPVIEAAPVPQPPSPPASAPPSRPPARVPSAPTPSASPPDRPGRVPPATPAGQSGLSPDEALARVQALVDDGAARNEIRPDVATDFGNLLRNLDQPVSDGQDDVVAEQVNFLRRKADTRRREGGLSPELARQLKAALDDVVSAI